MAKRIYVGGLSYGTTSEELRDYFEQIGPVVSADVITDRETGRSRGFGFVEMENDADADAAVEQLNGTELDGRTLTVSEARERAPRMGGFGGAAAVAAMVPVAAVAAAVVAAAMAAAMAAVAVGVAGSHCTTAAVH